MHRFCRSLHRRTASPNPPRTALLPGPPQIQRRCTRTPPPRRVRARSSLSSRPQPGLCVRRRRAHPGVPNISSGYSVVLRPRRLPRNRPKSSLRARRHKDEDTKTKRTREHARSADVRSARAMAASSKRHHATTSASASLCAAARLCGNQRVERPRETTTTPASGRREAVGRLLGVAVHDLERLRRWRVGQWNVSRDC